MNREIKFRAWHPELKCFIYFNDLKITHASRYFLEAEATERIVYHCWHEEVPLMQYTSLKDKNGKEIYEGDIFKGGNYKWDAVEFEDGKFVVNLRGASVYDLCELFEDGNCPEVIGNVFENPELLK